MKVLIVLAIILNSFLYASNYQSQIVGAAIEQDRNFPLLGFTLAAYNPKDWDNCKQKINVLKTQGFKMIVLTTSYAWKGGSGKKFVIDNSNTPGTAPLAKCISYAVSEGIAVVVKPHVDGGWRGGYDFDPIQSKYFDLVLAPEIKAINQVIAEGTDPKSISLCLGTEFSKSEKDHPESWVKILEKSKTALNQNEQDVHITYDFMFDFVWTLGESSKKMAPFIEGLDSISISQYTPMHVNGYTAEGVSKALSDYVVKTRKFLKENVSSVAATKIINFGEFGIGSSGLVRPWEYNSTRNDADTILGVQGLLDYMKSQEGQDRPMQFTILWTINSIYDIMGNWYQSKRSPVADEVEEYNSQVL